MSAWIYQKKPGANGSWYVGWYEAGRRRGRSCGGGEQGRRLAEALRLRLDAALARSGILTFEEMGRDFRLAEAEAGDAASAYPIPDGQGDKVLVYFVEAVTLNRIKIGAAVNVLRRLADLDRASPVPLRLLGVQDGGFTLENELHRLFADHRVRGEWFEAVPDLRDHIADHARSLVTATHPSSLMEPRG